jgi:hypothetical protein
MSVARTRNVRNEPNLAKSLADLGRAEPCIAGSRTIGIQREFGRFRASVISRVGDTVSLRRGGRFLKRENNAPPAPPIVPVPRRRPSRCGALRKPRVAPALCGGDLDPTFGSGGTLRFPYTQQIGTETIANGVIAQSDGKMVVVGSTGPRDNPSTDFFVARFNADGSMDRSFGVGGVVRTDVSKGGADVAYGVIVGGNGKITVVGSASKGPRPKRVRSLQPQRHARYELQRRRHPHDGLRRTGGCRAMTC